MSDDPENDKAFDDYQGPWPFDDLSQWPLDAIPNTDSGATEIRRRAVGAALSFLRSIYPDATEAELLEMLEIAVEDATGKE